MRSTESSKAEVERSLQTQLEAKEQGGDSDEVVRLEEAQERNAKLKRSMAEQSQSSKSRARASHQRYLELEREFSEYREEKEAELSGAEEKQTALRDEVAQAKVHKSKLERSLKKLEQRMLLRDEELDKLRDSQSRLDEMSEPLSETQSPLDLPALVAQNRCEKLAQQNQRVEAKYKKKSEAYSLLLSEYNEFISQSNGEHEEQVLAMDTLRAQLKTLQQRYREREAELRAMSGKVLRSASSKKLTFAAELDARPKRKRKPKPKRRHSHHQGTRCLSTIGGDARSKGSRRRCSAPRAMRSEMTSPRSRCRTTSITCRATRWSR